MYRHHRIFPCQRCKRLFKDQEEANQHLKEPKPCELRDVAQTDGLTSDIVEKLRSRKKSDKNQSEEDRWREIYRLLFPHEMVPGPCKCNYSHGKTIPLQLITFCHYAMDVAELEPQILKSSKRIFSSRRIPGNLPTTRNIADRSCRELSGPPLKQSSAASPLR